MIYMLYIWVAIAVIAAIVELATIQMVSMWFTAGALCALISYAAGAPYWGQLIVFFVVSFVFLICFRKASIKWLMRNIKGTTNSDALIGTIVKLTSDIAEDSPGTAQINDVVWTVIGKNGYTASSGTHVKIVDIQGNKLVVEYAD